MATVPPSASNPNTYISTSTTHERAKMGHNAARSVESRKMAFVPLSAPNLDTYIPLLTTNAKPQKKAPVPPSVPGTYIPASTSSQSARH